MAGRPTEVRRDRRHSDAPPSRADIASSTSGAGVSIRAFDALAPVSRPLATPRHLVGDLSAVQQAER